MQLLFLQHFFFRTSNKHFFSENLEFLLKFVRWRGCHFIWHPKIKRYIHHTYTEIVVKEMLNGKRLHSIRVWWLLSKDIAHMRRTIYANFHEHISLHIIMIFACNCIWMYVYRELCVCLNNEHTYLHRYANKKKTKRILRYVQE